MQNQEQAKMQMAMKSVEMAVSMKIKKALHKSMFIQQRTMKKLVEQPAITEKEESSSTTSSQESSDNESQKTPEAQKDAESKTPSVQLESVELVNKDE